MAKEFTLEEIEREVEVARAIEEWFWQGVDEYAERGIVIRPEAIEFSRQHHLGRFTEPN